MTDVSNWDGSCPLPTLYSKTATGAINEWVCWVVGDEVCVRWGQLNGAQQEARFKCLPKNEGRSNATTAWQQAVKEAVAKWNKQKKRKYSETLESAGKTVHIRPMLALDWKEHKHRISYPVVVQPKFDGVRCLAYLKDGQVYLQSRGGDPWLLPHLQRELQPALYGDYVLDGELYIHGMSLQSIISLAKRPRPESERLYYCVYDMFRLNEDVEAPYEARKNWRLVWFGDRQHGFQKVTRVADGLAANEASLLYFHNAYAEQGYEGAIIRSHRGVYRQGYRSPDLLKLKAWEDDEFVIAGFTVGKGKAENMPIFTCLTKEGLPFEVTPKGTEEERAELLQLAPTLNGQLMKVQYLGYTEDRKPRCARGLGVRDKSDL